MSSDESEWALNDLAEGYIWAERTIYLLQQQSDQLVPSYFHSTISSKISFSSRDTHIICSPKSWWLLGKGTWVEPGELNNSQVFWRRLRPAETDILEDCKYQYNKECYNERFERADCSSP